MIKQTLALKQLLRGRVRYEEPLSGHTYIKIGGRAEIFIEPEDNADLGMALSELRSAGVKVLVIGQGSNLLVSDETLSAAVIKLSSPEFKKIYRDHDLVYAGSGAALAAVIDFYKKNSFSGSEFLAGIPGTIGGALRMNAGTRNILPNASSLLCAMADFVEKIEIMDENLKTRVIFKDRAGFRYRDSDLKNVIILGAWFRFKEEKRETIEKNIRTFLDYKQRTQELSMPNAGCVFKNPQNFGMSAGEMIDKCSLKGKAIGDAEVSTIHANFIINKSRANFAQVRELMSLISSEVKNKFSVDLEPEVEIWKNNVE